MKKLLHFFPAFLFGMVLQTLLDANGQQQATYKPDFWWVIWAIGVFLAFGFFAVMFYKEWKNYNP